MKEKENYLDRVPVIKEDILWHKNKDNIVVIEQIHRGFFAFIATKVFLRPGKSYISLDEYGSKVWELIDSQKTIYEIGQDILSLHGEKLNPLYERLSKFIKILENSGFIYTKKIHK